MSEEKLLNAKITISRQYGGGTEERGSVCISVIDETSGIEFVEVYLTPEQFALAVTGLSACPAKLETRALQYVGKKREMKTEKIMVQLPSGAWEPAKKEAIVREASKSFEVDGWMCSPYRCCNTRGGMRLVGGTFSTLYECDVDFIRYVEVTE